METENRLLVFANILKTPLLRNILMASLIVSAIFPFYSIFHIIPSFNSQLTANTEDEALRTASYLKDLVIKEKTDLSKASFSPEDIREIGNLTRDFCLERIKIFSKQGEIIFSTTPNDIGELNKNDYFQTVVARGNVFTKVVKKNTKTLEGRMVAADVVETYVPMLANGVFIGAFEIYYDITARKEIQGNLLARIYTVLLAIVLIFLITVVGILFKASKHILEKDRAEEALRHSETKFRTLYDSTGDAVMLLNEKGFFDCNKTTLAIYGCATCEEFCSKHPSDLSPPQQPCGTDSLELANRMIVTAMEKGSMHFEWLHKRNDTGLVFPADVLLTAMELDGNTVVQAVVRDITEHKKMEAEILALSMTDQLTGLHNRRGFLSLAEHQLKVAERNKSYMLLFFADLDGLKWINDTLGHEEGDKALIEAATVLKETFRTSDIIARLGGDEFAALAGDITAANSRIINARLQSRIDMHNNQENRRYRLSISLGHSYYDPDHSCSLEELIASADKLMYEQKQKK